MVSAWPEPPSAMSAERSAGVRVGMEALAFGGTETPPNRAGRKIAAFESRVNLPGRFLQRAIFQEQRPPLWAEMPEGPRARQPPNYIEA